MRHAAKAALCLLVAALAVPAAWATTAVEHSESDLIQEAATIVVGRCTNLQSTWLERDLVTLATISVSEVLKGSAGAEITVVLPGGIDMNRPVPIAMSFPAAPEIFQQENVLLFLLAEDRLADGYGIVGFSQGKFTVVDSPGGKVATQNLGGLNLRRRDGQITRGASKAIPLEQLRQKIRSLAGGKPQARREQ